MTKITAKNQLMGGREADYYELITPSDLTAAEA
jgi:hypothetical protein